MNEPHDDPGSTLANATRELDAEELEQVEAGLGPAAIVRSGGAPGVGGARAGAGSNLGAHELTHTVQQRSPANP